MSGLRLRRIDRDEILARSQHSPSSDADAVASTIVEDVRARGEVAVREHGARLGDAALDAPLVIDREGLEAARASLPSPERELLERAADRIRRFAEAQRACLAPLDVAVDGGRAGHRWLPVQTVGAYAPGGRYPLPSSVLMTTIPARVAGVESVWVASPRPALVTLAAAAVAGADGVVAAGGAQAIAALAFGTFTPAADLVVGPGNRYVTAAKKHLVGEVGIDGLAGPSELVVIADDDADAVRVAADLLAQAEHDVDAAPILLSLSAGFVERVEVELERQLADLPTAETARAALERGGAAVVVAELDEAVAVSDALAPEHLALFVHEPERLAERLRSYGALFVGGCSAEAFGDYGIGPNHVLPTGRGARFQAGLSVLSFLRAATWLEVDDPARIAADTMQLARLEGLEAHARSAGARVGDAGAHTRS